MIIAVTRFIKQKWMTDMKIKTRELSYDEVLKKLPRKLREEITNLE